MDKEKVYQIYQEAVLNCSKANTEDEKLHACEAITSAIRTEAKKLSSKKGKKLEKGLVASIVAGGVLSFVGVAILPNLIAMQSAKTYKKTLKTDEIDFDKVGPEIVKKEQSTQKTEVFETDIQENE